MRTTITLDDGLLAQLKKRAAASGTTVSRLVEQAVRLFIRTPPAPKKGNRFELVTFGRGGRFSRQNIDKASRLIEDDNVARYAGHS
jgi:Ribbon-helix-helix protein, copG family